MKLITLGAYGGPLMGGRTLCCMLPELGIVLDAGSGCYHMADYLQTETVEIYLSHAHMDHTIGLTGIFDSFVKQEIDKAKAQNQHDDYKSIFQKATVSSSNISVFSSAAVCTAVQNQFGDCSPIQWQPLTQSKPIRGSGTLTYFPLSHNGVECYGFRLDWPDRSLGFVTDTIAAQDAAYSQYIAGVDVLLHDCYLPDSWAELATRAGHSHTSAVATLAQRAGVKHLVMIHLNQGGLDVDIDRARSVFPNTTLGQDGLEIEF